jgi:two-component system, cell cycle response regulator DivK
MAKSVLLVDDNEDLRHIVRSVLSFSGYEILEAESGSEAIKKAASAQPHVILLDLDLPDINGIDVARSIKRNQRSTHIPIIACSAFSSAEEKEEALSVGMVDYLQKPISSKYIKASIEKFILP